MTATRTRTTKSTTPDAANLADVLTELRAIRTALNAQGAAVLGRESAAAYLGISTATLERLTAGGKLKSVKVSEGRVGWTRRGLDNYLAVLESGN